MCVCQADDMVYQWLSSVRLERYHRLFTDSGYDLRTISRMTPEVLTVHLRLLIIGH